MSVLAEGFSFFSSDKFDNIFKSLASPVKVAFTAGLVLGLIGRDIAAKLYKAYAKVQQKEQRSLPPLTEDQKKELDDMLTFLQELLSANDNALFIDLKQSLKIKTEANEIKKLMEIVSPRLTMANLSNALRAAQFIAKVVRCLTDSMEVDEENKTKLFEKMNDITQHCFKADILMFYAENDNALALEIADGMRNRNIRVEMESEGRIGKPELSGLKDVLIEYAFIFIISADKLTDDQLHFFKKDMMVMENIYNRSARLIPVQPEGVSRENLDPVLRVLQPWKYKGDESIVQVEQHIKEAWKTIFKDEFKKN